MIGTPGFNGSRLEQARNARGLTVVALAEMLNAKSASITQYEHGKQSPSPEVLERIAVSLNVPREFFFKPMPEFDTNGIYFRSMSAATKTARVRAEARFEWLKEITGYLRRYLDFPGVNFPAFTLPKDVENISTEIIEEIANECRAFYRLGDGPIPDAVLLLENNGAIISRGELSAETLDAFSQWPSNEPTPYIFLGSDKSSAVRSRFDAAHELGHLILHRSIDRKAIRNNSTYALMEKHCHRFASAFLLPYSGFSRELWSPTLDGFMAMKPFWKVSVAGMLKRAEELKMIPEQQAHRMWINLTRRGWRKQEPLDDRLKPESPKLLQRSIEMLVGSHVKTKQQIATDLKIPTFDIEALASLPFGFFSLSDSDQAMPKLKQQEGNGTVIPFRSRSA